MKITAKKGLIIGALCLCLGLGFALRNWVKTDTASIPNLSATPHKTLQESAKLQSSLMSESPIASTSSNGRGLAVVVTETIDEEMIHHWSQFLDKYTDLKNFYKSIYNLENGVERAVVMSLIAERVGFNSDKEAPKFYEFAQAIISKDPKNSFQAFSKILPYVESEGAQRVSVIQSMVRLTYLNAELIPQSKNLLIKEITKSKELDSNTMTLVPLLVHLDQGDQWHQSVEERLQKWNTQVNWKSYLTQFDPIPEAIE